MPITPPYLQKGDKIALISTARKVSQNEMQPAIEIFQSWGLEVLLGKNLYEIDNQFAGSDDQRREDLQWALNHSDVKAIICARGGYGTSRIIDSIDFNTFLKQPKWVAGFSDITTLLYQTQKYHVECIHSIMPILFDNENASYSLITLKEALFGMLDQYTVSTHPLNKPGEAEGILMGGNLSVINNLAGTNADLNSKGTILFLEDIDEYLYHIDRMMIHLKQAGKLESLAGLIIGYFTDMKDNQIPFGKDAYQIISEVTSQYNIPVCFGFPVGHEFDNVALISGRKVRLSVSHTAVTLSF